MKVFIAGARSVISADSFVRAKLRSICDKQFDVLVGDCYGADSAVQSFLAECGYPRVTVYASKGFARNNIGQWDVKSVQTKPGMRGYEYFRQKDIAMAAEADVGFMIWDGESRGTLHNIITLASQGKLVLVYLHHHGVLQTARSLADVQALVSRCGDKAKWEFARLMAAESFSKSEQTTILY